MAGFFDDALKGFIGSDYLKDYRHASKTFRSAGYGLAPRFKFLFHVHFNLNTTELPGLSSAFGPQEQSQLSVLVKNITLPNYTIDVEEQNQYNRKRLVHSKVNYDPVTVEFHDDGSDLVRSLWFKYFSYYYKDAAQPYNTVQGNQTGANNAPVGRTDYNVRDIYSQTRAGSDWGYSAEDNTGTGTKPQFFKDITVYGLNQHSFVSYTLINPQITEMRHDQYDYSQGGEPMSNTMTIKYESVKYGSGAVNGQTGAPIPGFSDPAHYDKEPSALSRPGSNTSILGQGGLLDGGLGVFGDLADGNILGSAKKIGRIYDTIDKGDINYENVKEELEQIILRDGLPAVTAGDFNFSTPSFNPNSSGSPQQSTPDDSLFSGVTNFITSNGKSIKSFF